MTGGSASGFFGYPNILDVGGGEASQLIGFSALSNPDEELPNRDVKPPPLGAGAGFEVAPARIAFGYGYDAPKSEPLAGIFALPIGYAPNNPPADGGLLAVLGGAAVAPKSPPAAGGA